MKKLMCIAVLALVAVAQAEINAGMEKQYKEADANKDGKVDLAEFKQVLAKRDKAKGKPVRAERLMENQFKNWDKDGDKGLSLNEFWPGK